MIFNMVEKSFKMLNNKQKYTIRHLSNVFPLGCKLNATFFIELQSYKRTTAFFHV